MKKYIGIIAAFICIVFFISACNNSEDDNVNTSNIGGDNSSASTNDSSSASNTEITTEENDPVITDTNIGTNTDSAVITEMTLQTTMEVSDIPIAPIDSENGIVQIAETLIGIPFAENGSSPDEGFDNSGFIYYVLRENGFINCPRLTPEQAAMGTHIGYDELKSGDLAFFCTADSGNPDFGGIYIGEGQIIYSPMPGQTVKIADISSDYWRGTFVTGVSLS